MRTIIQQILKKITFSYYFFIQILSTLSNTKEQTI